MKSVYVAASSAEQNRARAAIEQLKAAGITVTSNWIEVIANRCGGVPNPRGEEPDLRVIRGNAVHGNKEAIRASDILWFLVPSDEPGCGGFYESGFADALGKELVFSGDTQRSVFTISGHEFTEDLEAFEFVVKIAGAR